MGRFRNRFLNFVSRYSPNKPFTEATATTALSRWLYRGHGEKYLSLEVSEDRIGRAVDAGPRRFLCPTKRQDYARWLPLREHLLGDQKGVVSDAETTLLPFIAVDIDRHDGSIKADDHQRIVIDAGRYLKTIPHVKWLVEVNPRNGSTKFFGFRRTGDHFTKREIKQLSSKIRGELIHKGLCHNNNVEVFPDNSHAVWLPMRRDKVTIVDDGMLARCNRKIRDVTYFPQRVFESIRCYSALNFMAWIHNGDNYDEVTLASALRYACAGLPDEVPNTSTHKDTAPSPAARELDNPIPAKSVAFASEFDSDEPNAFKRNWSALLPFARQFFRSNKRLPKIKEALGYLKINNLFSGRWEDNESNRRHRVGAILGKIAETFDPSLLQSNQQVQLDHGIRRWCQRHFPNGLKAKRRVINSMEMTCRVKTIHVPAQFVEHCVGVIAFCLNDSLENDALPVNRIKAVWQLVKNAPSWNQEYFQAVRRHLEQIGVVEIYDKNDEPGKAWRWREGTNFPTKKRSSSNGAGISKRPNTEGVREKEEGIEEERVYNTLYQTANPRIQIGPDLVQTRPPPCRGRPQSGKFHHQVVV